MHARGARKANARRQVKHGLGALGSAACAPGPATHGRKRLALDAARSHQPRKPWAACINPVSPVPSVFFPILILPIEILPIFFQSQFLTQSLRSLPYSSPRSGDALLSALTAAVARAPDASSVEPLLSALVSLAHLAGLTGGAGCRTT